jgi:hypothetical protein
VFFSFVFTTCHFPLIPRLLIRLLRLALRLLLRLLLRLALRLLLRLALRLALLPPYTAADGVGKSEVSFGFSDDDDWLAPIFLLN